jgi:hypothetical protein
MSSRSRRHNRLIDGTDFDSEISLFIRTLAYDVVNLRFPGWYGEVTLDNFSVSNDLSFYAEAITSNEVTGQDDVVALFGSVTNPQIGPAGGGSRTFDVLERNRLTNSFSTVIRITYRFVDDYLPFITIPPTVNIINDLPGVLDITFINGRNGQNHTIEFTADAPSGWYGDATFRNDSYTNAMTLSAEARTTLPTGRVDVTSLFGPIRLLAGDNTAFRLEIGTRLNNFNTEIALIYDFDIRYPEVLTPISGSITNVNNILGEEVTITSSTVSDFVYSLFADQGSGYFGRFTFVNDNNGFDLSLRAEARFTVNGQATSRELYSGVIPANNGTDFFERFASNRLPDVNTVIRLTYNFVNSTSTTVEALQQLQPGLTRSNVILGQQTDLTVGLAFLNTDFTYTFSTN